MTRGQIPWLELLLVKWGSQPPEAGDVSSSRSRLLGDDWPQIEHSGYSDLLALSGYNYNNRYNVCSVRVPSTVLRYLVCYITYPER